MNPANINHAPANQTATPSKRRFDPILQELYDVKAQLNKDAGYSVEKILERARESAKRSAAARP
jgi:hypothetical protein